jgi:hypothetical protein
MRTWLLHTTLAIVILGFAPAAHADLSKDCGELMDNLQSCTPYKCSYKKQAIRGSDKVVTLRYQVLGTSEKNTCHYKVDVGDLTMLDCKLSDESTKVFNEILAMQIDGSFQAEQKKLVASFEAKNPDLLDKIDPKFMALSTQMRDIMISECNDEVGL